jgi:hypothetical protein
MAIFKGASMRRRKATTLTATTTSQEYEVEDHYGNVEDDDNKFPFGVPGEEDEDEDSGNVGVSYVSVEGQIGGRRSGSGSEGRRKSMVFSERDGIPGKDDIVPISGKKGKSKRRKEPMPPPPNLKGILKSIFHLLRV